MRPADDKTRKLRARHYADGRASFEAGASYNVNSPLAWQKGYRDARNERAMINAGLRPGSRPRQTAHHQGR